MPDSKHRSPLTLEDILRLKRAERPSPEFWVRFEQELRQKQLAALIERRPWWHALPGFLAKPSAFLPIGATAVLAFTLVSVKFYSPSQLAQTEDHITEPTPVQPAAVAMAFVPGADFEQPAPVVAPTVVGGASELVSEAHPLAVVEPLSENLPKQTAGLTPWSASAPVVSPSAQLYAANSELTERVEARLGQSHLNQPLQAVYNRPQRSGGAVAELASVSALSSKRTRLLAQFNERQFSPEPQAPAIVRERSTRRLASTDSNYTEHVTRVGLKGDQVSLKF